jgi:hypothetical protein
MEKGQGKGKAPIEIRDLDGAMGHSPEKYKILTEAAKKIAQITHESGLEIMGLIIPKPDTADGIADEKTPSCLIMHGHPYTTGMTIQALFDKMPDELKPPLIRYMMERAMAEMVTRKAQPMPGETKH